MCVVPLPPTPLLRCLPERYLFSLFLTLPSRYGSRGANRSVYMLRERERFLVFRGYLIPIYLPSAPTRCFVKSVWIRETISPFFPPSLRVCLRENLSPFLPSSSCCCWRSEDIVCVLLRYSPSKIGCVKMWFYKENAFWEEFNTKIAETVHPLISHSNAPQNRSIKNYPIRPIDESIIKYQSNV